MIDYRYLKAFILTATHSSFSKAARELNIAQSAVSRQIKLLEEALGEELIIRSSKKVILTEKGKELYLASLNFEQTTKDIFEKDESKIIRIGAFQGILENWLHKVIEDYCKNFENNISIKVSDTKILREDLQAGKLDITFSDENIQSELISSLKIMDENLVIISKKPIEMGKLHQETWIVYNSEDNLLQSYKRKSSRVIQVENVPTMIKLVKAGIGISLVPDHVINEKDAKVLKQHKFSNVKKSEIYMGTLNFKTMPKHLKNFTTHIDIHCKKNP